MKVYSKIDTLPTGRASNEITKGCLVLEGGGWKGLYTLGVLDYLMEHGVNFSSVVGVSAGALSAVGYVAGQIGWGARIDLTYRHDQNYCGIGALRRARVGACAARAHAGVPSHEQAHRGIHHPLQRPPPESQRPGRAPDDEADRERQEEPRVADAGEIAGRNLIGHKDYLLLKQ